MMVRKVLGILLCVGIVSLVSGCYCYPPGYYPGYGRHIRWYLRNRHRALII
jgi:hypothetical protein